ncbi:MAG: hypothetical protein Q7T18_10020 [Sedimentisphaerales bacterium]|nr:hypothetical protein [Sedimentisphaerales bacterium]
MVKVMPLKWITVIICFILVFLALFASGMFKPLGHDEHMYCTAGALMAQGKMIYRDFSYVTHPPYHAVFLSVVYKLLHTTHYLLVGRLLSIICDCLIALFIFLIFLRTLGNAAGIFPGFAAVAMHLCNPFVMYAGGFAWHHSLILLCVIASFWLYTATNGQTIVRYWRFAVIAALLTFAAFMRITCVLIWLVFFAFILFEQRPLRQRMLFVGVFLPASCIVSLWPLYIIAQAPKAFWLDTITIPLLNSHYLHSIGMAYDKLYLVHHVFAQPIYLLTTLLGLLLWLMAFVRRKTADSTTHRPLTLAAMLAIAFFFIALITPTSWEQYFAMPIPFVILSMAYPLAELCKDIHINLVKFTAAAVVCLSLIMNPNSLSPITAIMLPSQYTPMKVHAIATDIALKAGKGNRILTLSPLFAIEGGCEIYPQLAAGPFAYRVANFMAAEDKAIAKVVGSVEIAQMMSQSPPSAIFLGTEPAVLETPLHKIAPPSWKTKTYSDGKLILLFGPN